MSPIADSQIPFVESEFVTDEQIVFASDIAHVSPLRFGQIADAKSAEERIAIVGALTAVYVVGPCVPEEPRCHRR